MFISCLISAEGSVKISDINTTDNFPEISLRVNINSGPYLPKYNLSEDDISVYENGYKVNYIKVTGKEKHQAGMIYFVLSVDSSKSISENYLNVVKKSVAEILLKTDSNDKIAVFRFNDKVVLMNDFSSDKNTILSNVEKIEREGTKTVLYDSIFDSISLLKSTTEGFKSVIIFTDGKDEGSSVTADDVISYAKSSNIPLHFMCMNSSANISKMQRISRLTGGRMILGENISEVPAMYRNLMGEINSEYVITYKSQLKAGDSNIPLKVNVRFDSTDLSDTAEISSPKFVFPNFKPDLVLVFLVMIFILVLIIVFLMLRIINLKKTSNTVNKDDSGLNDNNGLYSVKDEELASIVQRENRESEEKLNDEKASFNAWLIQKNGFELGRKFSIYWKEITVGRAKENSIIVNDEKVQDRHVKIKEFNNHYIIMDLATDNGTFLNGSKLLRPKELYDWDEIKIGNTVFLFRGINAD